MGLRYCAPPHGREELPPRAAQPRRHGAQACPAPSRCRQPRDRIPRGLEGLRGRRRRARPGDVRHRPRRVRVPRRPHRLGQVDDHAPAHQGAGADRPARSSSRAATWREITRKRVPYYRRNIGVVFQDFKLLPNRTVHDNVAYALQVTGRTPPGDPREGARHPAPHRPGDEAAQLPRPALGRRAAARLDRARVRQPPAAAAGRRADRQPRSRDVDRDHAAALPDQPHRHDGARRHSRPRDGRQDAPARDRADRGPHRARRGGRPVRAATRPRASSPPACAARSPIPRSTRPRRPLRAEFASAAAPAPTDEARLLPPRGDALAATQRDAELRRHGHRAGDDAGARRLHPDRPGDDRRRQRGARRGARRRLPEDRRDVGRRRRGSRRG